MDRVRHLADHVRHCTFRSPSGGNQLSRNHGHQLALTAGLHHCRGERVRAIDADLQDPPELIPEMTKLMDEARADVVFGQRRTRVATLFKTSTANLFYRLLQRLSDVQDPRGHGSFRLMSWRAVDILDSMPEQNRFILGMVSQIGLSKFPFLRSQRQVRR